jgi:hypothetical protein
MYAGSTPTVRETYGSGVRKATCHDSDGNETGFGGAPRVTRDPAVPHSARSTQAGSSRRRGGHLRQRQSRLDRCTPRSFTAARSQWPEEGAQVTGK